MIVHRLVVNENHTGVYQASHTDNEALQDLMRSMSNAHTGTGLTVSPWSDGLDMMSGSEVCGVIEGSLLKWFGEYWLKRLSDFPEVYFLEVELASPVEIGSISKCQVMFDLESAKVLRKVKLSEYLPEIIH